MHHGYKRNNKLFVVTAHLEANPLKNIKIKSILGTKYATDLSSQYVPTWNVGAWEQNNTSYLFETRGQSFGYNWSNYANYDQHFGKHHVGGTIGAEWQASNYNSTSVSVTNVPENETERYISASLGNPAANTIGSEQGANALSSYFAQGSYSYDSRYMILATVRRDGSSKFAPQYRWGTFPAFSVGWNVANENFMKNITLFSLLKIRAGWGKVGNQNRVSDYATYTLINGGNNYSFGGTQVAGFTITDFGNPLLRWEKTETKNIGIDLEFWNKRMAFSSDYFVRNTSDMIVPLTTPLYAGANGAQSNIGSVQNKGIEMALSFKSIKQTKLQYDFSANFTAIRNNVTKVGDVPIKGGLLYSIGYMTQTDAAMPIGTFWGLKTDGIFHSQQEADAYVHDGNKIQPSAKAGDVKFVDQNGDGKIDDKDYVNIGSPMPKFTFGFNSGITYKGFDLHVYVMGVQGNKIVNGLNRFIQSSTGQFNSTPNRLDAWTPENPSSNEPRMTASDPNQNTRFSDRYVQDGSYVRIQNITLGYSVPTALISKVRMLKLRFYVSADNLHTFTKYKGFDPEIGQTVANGSDPLNYGIDLGNYPLPRTFRAGMVLQF